MAPPTWRAEDDLPLSPAVPRPGMAVEGQRGSRVGAWSGPRAPVMRCLQVLQVFDVECVTECLVSTWQGGLRAEGGRVKEGEGVWSRRVR